MSRFQRVLLTGGNGQLANAIQRNAPTDCTIIALERQQLDIRDADAVTKVLLAHQPDCVINGAAYNLVDKAENEGAAAAFEINAIGVAHLARTCKEIGIPLVHFSTDFVFDGQKNSPYIESDSTRPLSVYGASKLAGENIALSSNDINYVIRVSRLFGPIKLNADSSGKKPTGNFPLTMLHLAQEHAMLRVVNDQIGTPSYTPDLAKVLWELLEKGSGGLFHLSNSGEVAFDEYARAVFEIAGINCQVQGVSSKEYNAPARRPHYSTLSNQKVYDLGIAPLRNWKEALEDYLQNEHN